MMKRIIKFRKTNRINIKVIKWTTWWKKFCLNCQISKIRKRKLFFFFLVIFSRGLLCKFYSFIPWSSWGLNKKTGVYSLAIIILCVGREYLKKLNLILRGKLNALEITFGYQLSQVALNKTCLSQIVLAIPEDYIPKLFKCE